MARALLSFKTRGVGGVGLGGGRMQGPGLAAPPPPPAPVVLHPMILLHPSRVFAFLQCFQRE